MRCMPFGIRCMESSGFDARMDRDTVQHAGWGEVRAGLAAPGLRLILRRPFRVANLLPNYFFNLFRRKEQHSAPALGAWFDAGTA